MFDRLRFWWRAVSRGGTRLNVWLGWFSSIVLILGVAAGIAVPLVFDASHWLTLVIIMSAVVVVLAEGSYLEWKEADTKRREAESAHPATPEPPPFELRYYTGTPPKHGSWVTSYFVGVTNPPGEPERRARMSVQRMDPKPRQNPPYPGVVPAFPYAVPPASGGSAAAGLTIQPGQEESWFIGDIGISTDGKINVWRFFRDLDASWELGPDERWRLYYRIECEGIPDRKFSIVLGTEDGKLTVLLEDPARPAARDLAMPRHGNPPGQAILSADRNTKPDTRDSPPVPYQNGGSSE